MWSIRRELGLSKSLPKCPPCESSGGGADLAALGTPVDLTDGTWTLLDPLSIVQSVSYDSGSNTNKVVCNAATATNDLVWTASSATHSGPRWYRALEIDKTAMTTDDFITGILRFGPDHGTADFHSGGVLGLCEDPTTQVTADILGAGLCFIYFAGGNVQNGVWGNNVATFESSHASARYARGTIFYGKGKAEYMMFQSFTSADALRYQGQRRANLTLTASQPVYEIVGLGTRASSNPIALNDEWAVQAWSAFAKQV